MFNFRRKSSNVDNHIERGFSEWFLERKIGELFGTKEKYFVVKRTDKIKQCKGCNAEAEYRDYCWECVRKIMLSKNDKK